MSGRRTRAHQLLYIVLAGQTQTASRFRRLTKQLPLLCSHGDDQDRCQIGVSVALGRF